MVYASFGCFSQVVKSLKNVDEKIFVLCSWHAHEFGLGCNISIQELGGASSCHEFYYTVATILASMHKSRDVELRLTQMTHTHGVMWLHGTLCIDPSLVPRFPSFFGGYQKSWEAWGTKLHRSFIGRTSHSAWLCLPQAPWSCLPSHHLSTLLYPCLPSLQEALSCSTLVWPFPLMAGGWPAFRDFPISP